MQETNNLIIITGKHIERFYNEALMILLFEGQNRYSLSKTNVFSKFCFLSLFKAIACSRRTHDVSVITVYVLSISIMHVPYTP